jgi:hypothetical protein
MRTKLKRADSYLETIRVIIYPQQNLRSISHLLEASLRFLSQKSAKSGTCLPLTQQTMSTQRK